MSRRVDHGNGSVQPVYRWLRLGEPGVLLLAGLMLGVLVSGLAVVNATHQHRTLFNELQQLRQSANMLEVQWGQLLIEHSTFGLDGRIELRAREELNMKLPEWSETIMVTHEPE